MKQVGHKIIRAYWGFPGFGPNGAPRYLRGMAISSPSAGRPGGVGGSPKKFPEKFSDNGVRDKHHRVSDVSVTSFSYILSRSGT